MSNIIAIIPARGGSKRIPRKNIRDFCGKPIIAYSIEAAVNSGIFTEVMVSTDDTEIAETAKRFGANIPFMRSVEASNDYATTADVLTEVMQKYAMRGITPEHICCIYPTAPFVNAKNLKNSYDKFIKKNADSLIPVVKFDFPPQRALIVKDDCLKFARKEFENTRSQDLETLYHDCGQFYWLNANKFLEEKTIFMNNTIEFELKENEVRDIDTEEDWKIAELLYKFINDITIRKANINDLYNVYELSNDDDDVRNNSINSSKILLSEHEKWFKNKINSNDCTFYIIENLYGEFIGQSRFDLKEDGYYISISIEKQFRNRNIGSKIINLLTEKFKSENTEQKVFAIIKPENIGSIKAFKKAGYSTLQNDIINDIDVLKLIHEDSK